MAEMIGNNEANWLRNKVPNLERALRFLEIRVQLLEDLVDELREMH